MMFVVVSDIFVQCVKWAMSLKICDCWIFLKISNLSLEYWKMSVYMHTGDDAHVQLINRN